VPNCQICPILGECQQAKKHIEDTLINAAQIRDCILVSHLNNEMDNYISIGLGDTKGYRPNAPDICTQTFHFHASEVMPKGLQTGKVPQA
jgi:hypothetical protein